MDSCIFDIHIFTIGILDFCSVQDSIIQLNLVANENKFPNSIKNETYELLNLPCKALRSPHSSLQGTDYYSSFETSVWYFSLCNFIALVERNVFPHLLQGIDKSSK